MIKLWRTCRLFLLFTLFLTLFYFAMVWVESEYGYYKKIDMSPEKTTIEKVEMAPGNELVYIHQNRE
ncbi:DUF4227 family protein [Bacillaceae bacterium SIJ1]|uniref:DUF4227 family protein n=1 Tax=Litoribacterium kuwaitense TaxID=1398745 RepID=UPI0013EE2BF7|nr:DUF4227 family protein [Litoribacterium kuwaitense]NGP43643.1 DUF4227 family protein [Litoribacterium kuwaitense]